MPYTPEIVACAAAFASVLTLALTARSHGRSGSLWRRAAFVALLANVPRLVGYDRPVLWMDGWFITASALAAAALLSAVLVQATRAVQQPRSIQLGAGVAGAAVALLSSVSFVMY